MHMRAGVIVFIFVSYVSLYSSVSNKSTEITKYTDVILSNLVKKEYVALYNSRPKWVNEKECLERFEENVSKIKIDSILEFLYHEKNESSKIAVFYKSTSDTEVIKITVDKTKINTNS